jgi:hypothetical protein
VAPSMAQQMCHESWATDTRSCRFLLTALASDGRSRRGRWPGALLRWAVRRTTPAVFLRRHTRASVRRSPALSDDGGARKRML